MIFNEILDTTFIINEDKKQKLLGKILMKPQGFVCVIYYVERRNHGQKNAAIKLANRKLHAVKIKISLWQ